MIDPRAAIGEVHLTISDLDRSIRFYQSHLGLHLHSRDGRLARLGAAGGAGLLVLEQCESAPRVRGTTGLYHFAILVPSRADLSRALRRLVETETVMQGAADHGVSEALYLADPDGNGIEIYRDRPRAEWPVVDGRLRMIADPVDFDALLAEPGGDGGAGLATATAMGHVHLHVSALDAAQHFYVDILGFDLMQRYGPSALFVSAGGYHHHIGLTPWAGVGAPPPPPGAIGLKHFVVRLSSDEELRRLLDRLHAADVAVDVTGDGARVRDPSYNSIQFKSN